MVSLAETFSSSVETFELLATDMKDFLRSDSSELPSTLKQISKITLSKEFSSSVSRISEAVTVGILRGLNNREKTLEPSSETESSVAERLLDKLLSDKGSGFASIVIGSFARNLISAVYSAQGEKSSDISWVHLICSEKVRMLLGDCIRAFVGTAVGVYLEKTMDVNAFEDLFSGLTNPKHETKTKELLISLCNNAMETLIKTSHQMLTGPTMSASSSSTDRDEETDPEAENKKNSGWVDAVSSTLSVPTNRSFVLDVTGRVASETVKSFLEIVPRSLSGVIRGEIREKGSEAMRFLTQRSLLSVTVCLALCLHVFSETRVLV